MNRTLLYTVILCFAACSEVDKKEEVDLIQTESKYTLINDNLFSDENGNLYLKSVNREDMVNEKVYDVWLKTVYCDSCWTRTEDGWNVAELKDFVDVSSFHFHASDSMNGGIIYEDRNYRYFHK